MENIFGRQSITLEEKLLEAVFKGDLQKVEELLREGAAVNAQGKIGAETLDCTIYTPLTLAAEIGNVELVERLLNCPDIAVNYGDFYGHTALHKATKYGNVEVLKLLLTAKDIEVNAQSYKQGYSPLHLVGGDGAEILEMLLRAPGILVNKKDQLGKRALHHLACGGHAEEVGILLKAPGVMVNEKDNGNHSTPLHRAVDLHHVDVIAELLNHPDIDVNVKDCYGRTALHISSIHGTLKLVEMLLEAGVDVKAKDDGGRTAAYYAAKLKHAKVFEAIVNHMKNSNMLANLCLANTQVDLSKLPAGF